MKNPTISIKNVDVQLIDRKYNFIHFDNSSSKVEAPKTKVAEIQKNHMIRKVDGFSYIDEAKKEHICNITMRNSVTKDILPDFSNSLHCYWCRHLFSSRVLGCPIDYKCSMMYKKYYSEITKNNYCLQESLTEKQNSLNKAFGENEEFNIDFMKNGYFVTDGIFCSFNCCVAFIQENSNNPFYTKSLSLLHKIYYQLFQVEQKILPAPNWRLLKPYGGVLSIQEFRKGFYKVEYIDNSDYVVPSKIPIFKSIGMVFEKKIKL